MASHKEPFAFLKRKPYFTPAKVQEICSNELAAVGLLPSTPAPIRIDRFIEKRYLVTPSYEKLPRGVLGYTKFTDKGVSKVVVSELLGADLSQVAERRVRTTLAHEAGHGLLHTNLFSMGANQLLPFGQSDGVRPMVLCRENTSSWWEVQANMAMASLLMPLHLVEMALEDCLGVTDQLEIQELLEMNRNITERSLAEIFDVNPVVAKYRLEHMYPLAQAA